MARFRTPMAILVAMLAPWTLSGAADLRDVPVHRDGTPFALHFTLGVRAHPILVRVDALGRVALVHPDETLDTVPGIAAGRETRVPGTEAAPWRLSGTPGYETFLLAASPVGEVDLFALTAEMKATAEATVTGGGTRADVVEAIDAFLVAFVGPTRDATILHLP